MVVKPNDFQAGAVFTQPGRGKITIGVINGSQVKYTATNSGGVNFAGSAQKRQLAEDMADYNLTGRVSAQAGLELYGNTQKANAFGGNRGAFDARQPLTNTQNSPGGGITMPAIDDLIDDMVAKGAGINEIVAAIDAGIEDGSIDPNEGSTTTSFQQSLPSNDPANFDPGQEGVDSPIEEESAAIDQVLNSISLGVTGNTRQAAAQALTTILGGLGRSGQTISTVMGQMFSRAAAKGQEIGAAVGGKFSGDKKVDTSLLENKDFINESAEDDFIEGNLNNLGAASLLGSTATPRIVEEGPVASIQELIDAHLRGESATLGGRANLFEGALGEFAGGANPRIRELLSGGFNPQSAQHILNQTIDFINSTEESRQAGGVSRQFDPQIGGVRGQIDFEGLLDQVQGLFDPSFGIGAEGTGSTATRSPGQSLAFENLITDPRVAKNLAFQSAGGGGLAGPHQGFFRNIINRNLNTANRRNPLETLAETFFNQRRFGP